MEEKQQLIQQSDSDYDDDYGGRRSHMNSGAKEEYCKICVCSVEGKDEYCSGRPARNVNECIRMAGIMQEFTKNIPFDHTRTLAYRIRRDYIWHNDEIPYDSRAKCRRGTSYYTNNINAHDTDIDVPTEIESLLDYPYPKLCLYCVCAVDGSETNCMRRDYWLCNYFRAIKEFDAPRDMYAHMLKQDRPTYFRHLPWRVRRTMDQSIYDFQKAGGDTLCCSHPNGHRRHLHNSVRSKLHQMRRKVPKENLLGGSPGGDYVDFIVNND